MSIRVFGVYDKTASAADVAARKVAIIRCCRGANLPVPNFDTPDFMMATIVACEARSLKKRVWLVGSLNDLKAPQEDKESERGFSDEEWREGWLAYLGEESLSWLSINAPSFEFVKVSRVSVIRSYRRAMLALMRLLAKARSRRSKDVRSSEPRYTSGRPPYGYRAKDGCLEHDVPGVLARVRKVYELIRGRVSVSRVAAAMTESEKIKPAADRQSWDPVKVRRLLSHASLYCLGEYRSEKLVKRAPELAFLPSTWSRTVPYRKTLALKAESAGAVSSRPRSGKVQVSAPASAPPPN